MEIVAPDRDSRYEDLAGGFLAVSQFLTKFYGAQNYSANFIRISVSFSFFRYISEPEKKHFSTVERFSSYFGRGLQCATIPMAAEYTGAEDG